MKNKTTTISILVLIVTGYIIWHIWGFLFVPLILFGISVVYSVVYGLVRNHSDVYVLGDRFYDMDGNIHVAGPREFGYRKSELNKRFGYKPINHFLK